MLAAGSWAAGSLYSRDAPLPKGPLLSAGLASLAGGFLLATGRVFSGELGELPSLAGLRRVLFGEIYLIVMGSFVGLTAYVWLLKNAPISLVATYAYVNPVVAVLIGWAFLSETFSPMIILAGGAIIAAVALIVSAPTPREGVRTGAAAPRAGARGSGHAQLGTAGEIEPAGGPGSDTPLATRRASTSPTRRSRRSRRPGTSARRIWPTSSCVHDLPLVAGRRRPPLSRDCSGRRERLAAELWGADLCRFCVNGSTQGNQALALAAARPGDAVVVSRNLHKSVFAGLVLAGLEPVWVRPDIDAATGLPLARSGSSGCGTRSADGRTCAPSSSSSRRTSASCRDVGAIAGAAHERGHPARRRPGLGRALRLPSGSAAVNASRSARTGW